MLVLLTLFVWLDAFALMTVGEVLVLLALGFLAAVAAYPISASLLQELPISAAAYSDFIAPWIEEGLKAAAVILLFARNRIGYKVDAVISGFAIGAGFSLAENLLYLSAPSLSDLGTWVVRGLGTAAMHGTTVALLAAIAHEIAERSTRTAAARFHLRLWWFLPGYLIAVLFHGLFNQLADKPLLALLTAGMVAPLALIAIFHFGTGEATSWLLADGKRHRSELASLNAGQWPETRAGQSIAAFANRLGSQGAGHVRRYWQLQTMLVAQAEETMVNQGLEEAAAAQVRAGFHELEALRKALGPSVLAELHRLLPFSRNDQWELAEFRQRLRRR